MLGKHLQNGVNGLRRGHVDVQVEATNANCVVQNVSQIFDGLQKINYNTKLKYVFLSRSIEKTK